MNATAELEAPTEGQPLVSQPDTAAVFMARRSDLRLVKRPIRLVRDAEGNAVDQTPGETVAFQEGILRVPLEKDATLTLTNGERADAADIFTWLEGHRLKGDYHEGFWRVNASAPPPSREEIDTLQTLAINLDIDGLQEFIAQERGGWARPELIEIAEGSAARIAEKIAELKGTAPDA